MKNKPVKTEKQTGDITNVITWDEFISYGLNHFSSIVDGIPWSFYWMGFKSTHENDRLYIIEGLGNFTPTDLIVERWNEEYSIISTQEQGDVIEVPLWRFKAIEDALRLTNNIYKLHRKETAYERSAYKAYQFAKDLLSQHPS